MDPRPAACCSSATLVKMYIGLLLCVGHAHATTTGRTTPSTTPAPGGGWAVPQEWYKEQIPNPRLDTDKCGRRGRRSWVCDPNEILSYDEANALDQQIEVLRHSTGGCHCEKSSKCPSDQQDYGGWQAGVVVLRKMRMPMHQPSSEEKKEVADDFTDYLREDSWEFGVCDDDLILLLSAEDRIVYTKTGDSMSSTLTDKCVDEIFEDNKHYMRQEQWAQGLKSMMFNYTNALQKEHPCNKSHGNTVTYVVIGVIGALVAVIVGVFFCRRRSGGCESSGGDGGHHHSSHHHSSGRRSSTHSNHSNSSGGGGGEF